MTLIMMYIDDVTQVRAEFVRRVSKRVQDRIANPEMWAADPINMGAAGYRWVCALWPCLLFLLYRSKAMKE